MVRRHSWLVLVAVLVIGAVPLSASSTPPVSGQFVGIELCEQAVCGAALFSGLYVGQFGSNPFTIGTINVAVKHAPLPDPGDPAAVTGGAWQLKALSGRWIAGLITGGTLFNNGDGTFGVSVNMLVTVNGGGTLNFQGTLSHNTFPPTISGFITP